MKKKKILCLLLWLVNLVVFSWLLFQDLPILSQKLGINVLIFFLGSTLFGTLFFITGLNENRHINLAGTSLMLTISVYSMMMTSYLCGMADYSSYFPFPVIIGTLITFMVLKHAEKAKRKKYKEDLLPFGRREKKFKQQFNFTKKEGC